MSEQPELAVLSADPDAAPTTEPAGPDLGTDLFEDQAAPTDEGVDEPSAQDTAPPEDQPTTTTTAFDPNSLPPEAQEYIQRRERELQGTMTRATQDAREQQRAAQQREQEFAQRLQALEQGIQQPQQAPVDPLQAIRANLSPEEAQGLDVVQTAAQTIFEQQAAPLLQRLEQLEQQLTPLQQTAQTWQQQREAERRTSMATQISEAEAEFDRGTLGQYTQAGMLGSLVGKVDPNTGQPHTVLTAMRLLTGRAAQEAAEVRGQQQQARNQAKSRTRPTPATAPEDSNGILSPDEVDEQIEALWR